MQSSWKNPRHLLTAAATLLGLIAAHAAFANEPEKPVGSARRVPTDVAGPFQRFFDASTQQWRSQTLGGRLFWGDVAHFRGWRIQHNVFTGHHRLLDPQDVRHVSGTLEECRERLDAVKQSETAAAPEHVVVLVHGMGRSSKCFSRLHARLESAGYAVVPFDYPSTRVTIARAAEYLASTLDSLDGVKRVDFVVHSMGGLVVRSYLSNHEDPRIGRLVMFGTPNYGSEVADLVKDLFVYDLICGPAGRQLVTADDGYVRNLDVPKCEFAVIAAGRGDEIGWNPLLPGDDDGLVSVSATRLPGAADFTHVKSLHATMLSHREAMAMCQRFLETGRLRANGAAMPISTTE